MAVITGELVDAILKGFSSATQKPEVFLSANTDVAGKLQKLTKEVYDVTKSIEESTETEALPELLVDGFDDEQVWQELELQNSAAMEQFLQTVSRLATSETVSFQSSSSASKKRGAKTDSNEEMDEEGGLDEANEDDEEEMEDEEIEEEEDEEDDDFTFGKGLRLTEGDEEDESEEEIELKKLLDKAHAENQEEGDSSEDEEEEEDLFGENFELDQQPSKKGKKKQKQTSVDDSQQDTSTRKDQTGRKQRRTVVDDQFFKLADMEAFLDQEDTKEERKQQREEGNMEDSDDEDLDEDEDIDVFADIPSDDDEGKSARKLRYKDFFDVPSEHGKKKKKYENSSEMADEEENSEDDEGEEDDKVEEEMEEEEEEDEDEEEEEGEEENEVEEGADSKEADQRKRKNLLGDDSEEDEKKEMSSFEQRQARLVKKIKDLEKSNLSEKPWQLTGEVSGAVRPENSLLQEDLDFEQQTRLAPEITEETTKTLEEIIIQRIKDQAWDDVERKVKPVDAPFEYKKRLVLDQDKSKKSLSQIYEEEYLKQAELDKEEKEDPQHEDIRKSMTALFIQLDALANFHYTPKPAAPDVKVVSNLPSINVEEVAPVSVSEAAMLAPEEIKEKERKELKGDTEKEKKDKVAERRAKKTKQRARKKEKEKRQKLVEKLNPGLGNKYAKEKALKELEKHSKGTKSTVSIVKEGKGPSKDLTSSSKFFSKLQDQVSTQLKDAKKENKKKKKSINSSAKLKL